MLTACTGLLSTSTASRLSPPWLSESRLVEYFDAVAKLERQVVNDEIGTYYHRTMGRHLHVVYFSDEDRAALKRLFTDQVGLLEPVYRFDDRGRGAPDWGATERRHAALSATGRLRLAPLETTRLYALAVDRFGAAERSRQPDSVLGQLAAIRSGDATLFNRRFASQVLAGLPGPVDYVVSDGLALHYYSQLLHGAPGGPGPALENLRQNMRYTTSTEFVPRSYLTSIREGAVMRVPSGCRLTDKDEATAFARWVGAPGRERAGDFAATMRRLDELRVKNDELCWSSLAELGITGAVQSERLR